MHISEGVLPGWCLVAGWVLTAGGLYVGLKSIEGKEVPKTALLSAAFFVASLIHIPVGITSVHLLLNGLAGALLGWAVFPALFVALLFQALLFQFGGITVLGVNTFNMAFPGVVAYYAVKHLLKMRSRTSLITAGVVAAVIGVFLSAAFLSLELVSVGSSFTETAKLAFLAHVPVAVVESFVNAFVFLYFKKSDIQLGV